MAYKQKNNPFSRTECGRRYGPLNQMIKGKFNSPFTHKTGSPHCHPNFNPDGSPSDEFKKQLGDLCPDSNKGGKIPADLISSERESVAKPKSTTKKKGFGPQSPTKQTNKRTKGKGRHFRSKEEGAGMTKAGVASYKKQNPGSKLKTAVTGKPSTLGPKAAARRKSFCARSKSWTGERGKAARARWRC